MSRIDEELARLMRRAERPVGSDGVSDRVRARRRRYAATHRAGNVALSVIVLAGTLMGYRVLDRAFQPALAADGGGGVIAFRRFLRPCDKVPHVSGGLDIFAVSPDGSTQWRFNPDAMHDARRSMFESQPTFSPDGERYAWVDHYADGLWVTDVRTNTTTQLVEGWVAGPSWLPDGSGIIYTGSISRDRWHLGPDAIFSVPASGGEPTVLAENASLAVVSPNGGTIAFLRNEQLGEPEGPVITDDEFEIRTSLWFMDADGGNEREMRVQPGDAEFSLGDADWAPDGIRFVVEATVDGNTDLYVVNIDGETGYRLTDDPADDTSPSWSPDGQMIAFQTGRWGRGIGHAEIAMVSASGGEPTRLTNDCWDDWDPEWVPNDSVIRTMQPWTVPPLPDLGERGVAEPGQIVFSARFEGVADLYAIDPEGGRLANLTTDVPEQGDPNWSPDYRWIAFSLYGHPELDDGLYVMRADGSGLRLVAERGGRASWSADGNRLAIETDHGIEIVDVSSGKRERVTGGPHDSYPAWSPNGESIAFARFFPEEQTIRLFLVDLATERERPLTEGPFDLAPSWAPDGSWIAFERGRDLAKIRPDGTGLTVLTSEPSDEYDRSPVWSPDGSRIAFVSSRPPGPERDGMWLWTMAADGSNPRPVDGSPSIVFPGLDW